MEPKQEIVKYLGQGAYGSVNLVKYTYPDGSSLNAAVKTSLDETLYKEYQILSELRGYSGIVECYDLDEEISDYGNRVYKLLLEYASKGSLHSFMDNYTDRKLPVPMIRDFTYMILEGLVFTHSHGYVHCDLKSENILVFPSLKDSYEVKISDFGNTLEVGEVPCFWGNELPFIGTPNYMSPESLGDGVAKETLDLWSVGCLVLEMFTGKYPWKGIKTNDLKTLLLDGNAPKIPEGLPCDAREFIETCFSKNPEDRGTAYDLLYHRFLCREEEKKIVDDVAVAEKKRNSLLLKLKLRIRRALKKSKDVQVKPLKLKEFSSKPPQYKIILNKLMSLKMIHMKPLDCGLVSVQ